MGFLSVYTNNGICIGANCGNFVVDTADGETCDPPNLAPGPNGQPACRLDCTSCGDGVVQANNTETCDDGNLISGCRTDKPQKPLDSCLNNCNEPICADPARIKFGTHDLPDAFTFHGRLISDVPVDFINNHFVIELRDSADNVIYRTSLVRGSIEVQNAKSTRYKNRGARAAGGIYQLKTKAAAGYYVLQIKAYGDMRSAVSDMRTHVYIGADEWAIRGLWTAQGEKGWKLSNKATFLPVP
jgi:cysteine-rich repeat protein